LPNDARSLIKGNGGFSSEGTRTLVEEQYCVNVVKINFTPTIAQYHSSNLCYTTLGLNYNE
jgi:hypothetical protein